MFHVLKYRTKDGQEDYEFHFSKRLDGSWRAYILDMPDYGSRSTSCVITHRLHDEDRGLYYICWNRPVTSFEDIKKVAALWADKTQRYIRFGESF